MLCGILCSLIPSDLTYVSAVPQGPCGFLSDQVLQACSEVSLKVHSVTALLNPESCRV